MFGSTLNYCKNADTSQRQVTTIFRIFPPLPRLNGDTSPGEAVEPIQSIHGAILSSHSVTANLQFSYQNIIKITQEEFP